MTNSIDPTDANRDYVTSTSVTTTSTLTVVAADAVTPGCGGGGEALPQPGCTAAMLRLSTLFPYTLATDLALAGYDVLGYTPIPAWLVTE